MMEIISQRGIHQSIIWRWDPGTYVTRRHVIRDLRGCVDTDQIQTGYVTNEQRKRVTSPLRMTVGDHGHIHCHWDPNHRPSRIDHSIARNLNYNLVFCIPSLLSTTDWRATSGGQNERHRRERAESRRSARGIQRARGPELTPNWTKTINQTG